MIHLASKILMQQLLNIKLTSSLLSNNEYRMRCMKPDVILMIFTPNIFFNNERWSFSGLKLSSCNQGTFGSLLDVKHPLCLHRKSEAEISPDMF